MNAASLLAIGGAVFEVVGLALVVIEIVKDRRQARVLLGVQGVIVQTLPAMTSIGAIKVTPTEEREPMLEERVARVEKRVEALNDGLLNTTDRLRAELQRAASEAFNQAYREMVKKDQSMRRYLHQQVTGGVGRRLVGVVFFALGAVLSAAANVFS